VSDHQIVVDLPTGMRTLPMPPATRRSLTMAFGALRYTARAIQMTSATMSRIPTIVQIIPLFIASNLLVQATVRT
jgi:hypothetical protein